MIRRRRFSWLADLDKGSNTVFSHSYAWLSDVYPLLLIENLQSGGVLVGIQAVLVCFAFKMTSGGIATPAALIHSIAVIHSCRPLNTFQLDCSRILTNALDDWLVPTANPDSSML
jgi:hypothetical protein